jgi:hypothetical protein
MSDIAYKLYVQRIPAPTSNQPNNPSKLKTQHQNPSTLYSSLLWSSLGLVV